MSMRDWGADAVVCSGYKWLSAHGGVALLAVDEELAQETPYIVGWKGTADPFDFHADHLSLAPDARRFELSTMSYGSAISLSASLALLAGLGMSAIAEHADSTGIRACLPRRAAGLGPVPLAGVQLLQQPHRLPRTPHAPGRRGAAAPRGRWDRREPSRWRDPRLSASLQRQQRHHGPRRRPHHTRRLTTPPGTRSGSPRSARLCPRGEPDREVHAVMRAIVYTSAGGPEVLRLVDRPIPEPGPGEVRVMIHVSGVNPTDWKRRASALPPASLSRCPTRTVPASLTQSATGCRSRGSASAPGSSRPPGSARTVPRRNTSSLPERQAVPLPDHASFALGASLGIPALTAHRTLTVAEGGPERLAPGALSRQDGARRRRRGSRGQRRHSAGPLGRRTGDHHRQRTREGRAGRRGGADHVVNYRTGDTVEADPRRSSPTASTSSSKSPRTPTPTLDRAVAAPRRPSPSTPTTARTTSDSRSGSDDQEPALAGRPRLHGPGSTPRTTPSSASARPSRMAPCTSAKPPACRCTRFPWRTPRERTPPSRTGSSAKS